MSSIVKFVLLALFEFIINSNSECLNKKELVPRFEILKYYQRSQQPIVSVANLHTVIDCAEFTTRLKGLAFNFSPLVQAKLHRRKTLNSKAIIDELEDYYNCHALQCPENANFSTMINDSRYDYYSLYSLVPLNSVCLPQIGLVKFFNNPQNYRNAQRICKSESMGSLAHIASSARTPLISGFVSANFKNTTDQYKFRFKNAYVGLAFSTKMNTFITSQSEKIDCFLYTAWAPGHPRQHQKSHCVAITIDNSWVTVDCKSKLPFVCDIYASYLEQSYN